MFSFTQSDDNLFNLAHLKAKTEVQVQRVLTREMLFAEDAALAAHTEEAHDSRRLAQSWILVSQSASKRPISWAKMLFLLQPLPKATPP